MDIQKFEFTDYEVAVEISGNRFKLDCSSDTGDYLKKCAGELNEMASAIEKGEKRTEDAVQYGASMLDTLLGTGAAKTIFSNRKQRLSDIVDLCLWLTEVAAKFQQERAKLKKNRAMRMVAKEE